MENGRERLGWLLESIIMCAWRWGVWEESAGLEEEEEDECKVDG